ncbi:hypothetical protein GURASL_13410 [Geotalea uraniireducens]|uniref:Uncharacterized protein n=1 Tax=Geotalea uraniireducens TaxID=351604 RepID=A0ABN6VQ69_9BACT|nr:hypothetical protein [Geotalea uraniireducens]BDV42418.1 hypothetical protein GURASL_13410 [Geotalea uraniireducens]
MPSDDYDYEERAAIMEHCGGLDRHEAKRLARERPWETDKWWGMPQPEQLTFEDDPLAGEFFQSMKQKFGGW